MRAVVQTDIGPAHVLKLTETDVPRMRAGTLLLRTTAIGVNFHDVEVRRRGEPGLRLPVVPGSDAVGVVEGIGRGVTGFELGDRVAALVHSGAYADYVSVSATTAVRIPDAVDDASAASIPTAGLTAWYLVRDFAGPGVDSVVCHAGAGGVGHWLGSLLARRPAHAVAVVSSEAKAAAARRAGFDTAVVRSEHADLVRAVRLAAGGYGAGVVLDPIAGERFGDSFGMLRPGGTVVLYGRTAGPPDRQRLSEVFLDARRNLGLRTWYLGRAVTLDLAAVAPALAELARLLADGAARLPVTELPLEEAAEAHLLMESGATVGKVVLRP